jgi:bifunctional non-homologous end joining protein LigD
MLAVAAAAPPADDHAWAFELKLDGARALYHAARGRATIHSRTGRDLSGCLPELAELARALDPLELVLDGELIVADAQGRPRFEQIMRRLRASSGPLVRQLRHELPVTYVIFDLLWRGDRPVLTLPYQERRALLEALDLTGPAWHTVDSFTGADGTGLALLAASRSFGLEGIVAKRTSSPYRPGRRSRAWLKVKNFTRDRFWVGGWLPGAAGVGALLLGTYADRSAGARRLRFEGLVETGLSPADRLELAHRLTSLERPSSPFEPAPRPDQLRSPFRPGAVAAQPAWVHPLLQIEAQYLARTTDGRLRHASYKGTARPLDVTTGGASGP